MISDFRYVDDLILRRLLRGNGKLFVIDREYKVFFCVDGAPTHIYVPAGVETDLASIPTVVPRWIAQQVDAGLEAAIVHDWLYLTQGDGRFTREQSDEIFLAALETAGVPAWRRTLMFQAVRKFGGAAWRT